MRLRALKDLPTSVNPIRKGEEFIEEVDERAKDWVASGYAEVVQPASAPAPTRASALLRAPAPDPLPLVVPEAPRPRPDWSGCPVAIIASGPSLSLEQCEQVRTWRASNPNARVVAINTSFRRAPFADVLYACDGAWWRAVDPETKTTYFAEASAIFPPSAMWTQDAAAAKEFSLRFIASRQTSVLMTDPKWIAQGANSGIQAMNLAYHFGARRMLLLGIDLKGKHWHADHPAPLSNSLPHRAWRDNFATFAESLREAGASAVNCSPDSALKAFPSGVLAEELAK